VTRKRIHRLTTIAAATGLMAVAAPAAHAAAPGWSTPHTASTVTTGTYASAPNGQGVQLFANGGVPQRTGQLRAIKTDATQGTAVGVNANGPGFDLFNLEINNNARLVAAWTKDLQNAQPVPVAVAFGTRTSLPRTASVFPSGGQVGDLASDVADNGTAVVAWVETPITPGTTINNSPTTIRTVTLRSGQAPIVTTVGTRTGALINNLAVGFDGNDRAIVTWNVTTNENGGPGILAVARGTGPGTFAPAVETTVDPTQQLLDLVTFVTNDGGLLLFWTNGSTGQGPIAIRYSQADGAGAFTAPRTLISGNTGGGLPTYAANAAGRAAVVFPLASGNGTSLRVMLRTSSGTWGSARLLGPSGTRTIRRISLGVDARGRVVALWDDAGGSSSTPTRILAARSSSSTNPLNTYNQVSQRSSDKRCQTPSLALSSSGDGFGSWLCSTSSSGSINGPRLARLTAPS
jgi:hypothetical protein